MSETQASARRRSRPPTFHLAGPVLSGLLALSVFCAGTGLSGRFPFGGVSRDISDLGAQFVPFQALWGRMLRPGGPGVDSFTWQLGYGVPFLGDFATYLASPFSSIMAFFGPEHASTGLFVVVSLKLAAGATSMTAFLLAAPMGDLGRARTTWAVLLGVAWATCGWAIDDGTWMPMWLDALWGVPLLLWAVEWSRQGRRFVLGTVVVAVFWWSNFYVAYMGSVLAALYAVARALESEQGWRDGVRAVGRFALRGILGTALVMILLVPTVMAIGDAQPAGTGEFVRKPWSYVMARFMPMTAEPFAGPGLFVGLPVVAAAAMYPFAARLGRAERLVWPALAAALLVSFQVSATQLAWHAFSMPHGGNFREAFVLCAWLIIMAWRMSARRTTSWSWGAGAAVLGLLGLTSVYGTGGETVPATGIAVLLVTVAAMALAAWTLRRGRPQIAAGITGAALVAGSVLNVVAMERNKLTWDAYPVSTEDAAPPTADEQWPMYRSTGGTGIRANSGGLDGHHGGSYYSSLASRPAAHMAERLGLGWTSSGRGFADPGDPVAASLMSASAHDPQHEVATFPMVRVVAAADEAPDGVVAARNAVAGAQIYRDVDSETFVDGRRVTSTGGDLPVRRGQTVDLVGECRPGDIVQVVSPGLAATVSDGTLRRVLDASTDPDGGLDTMAEPATLSAASASRVHVTMEIDANSRLASAALACADPSALRSAVESAEAPAEVVIRGSAIDAGWDVPQTGRVLVATAAHSGWECEVDGVPAPTGSTGGMLSIPFDGARDLSCSFRPPGLTAGIALSAAAAVVLVVGASFGTRSRRDRGQRARSETHQR